MVGNWNYNCLSDASTWFFISYLPSYYFYNRSPRPALPWIIEIVITLLWIFFSFSSNNVWITSHPTYSWLLLRQIDNTIHFPCLPKQCHINKNFFSPYQANIPRYIFPRVSVGDIRWNSRLWSLKSLDWIYIHCNIHIHIILSSWTSRVWFFPPFYDPAPTITTIILFFISY